MLYKDIDLSFRPHPVTGDVVVLKDDKAVMNSVKNLVLTNFHERMMEPLKGGNVRAMLFENMTPLTRHYLEKHVSQLIDAFEPRAKLISIDSHSVVDENTISLTMKIEIIELRREVQMDLILKRDK